MRARQDANYPGKKAAPGHPQLAGCRLPDPKKLDAKLNGKLKLDLSKVPPTLAFTLEMDGKLYFEGKAGDKAAYDTLFVPPGVQEFRVTVSGGRLQKISNVASADFKAKKGETLKVELRTAAKTPADTSPGTSPGTPPVLSPDAQVIATLKDSSFFSRQLVLSHFCRSIATSDAWKRASQGLDKASTASSCSMEKETERMTVTTEDLAEGITRSRSWMGGWTSPARQPWTSR